MKNKTKNLMSWGAILVFLAIIIVLIVVNVNSGNSNPEAYSSSALTVIDGSFDFDMISMEDGDVSHIFEVENNGTELVKIEKAYTSCMCTIAYITTNSGKKYGEFGMQGHGSPSKTNIEIRPGESVSVEVIFDPSAHGPSGVGLAQRSLYLETNSAKSPKLELSFQAIVVR